MGTDRKLLELIYACVMYVNAKDTKNPFVKGFEGYDNVALAYEDFKTALAQCQEYFPEVEQLLESEEVA